MYQIKLLNSLKMAQKSNLKYVPKKSSSKNCSKFVCLPKTTVFFFLFLVLLDFSVLCALSNMSSIKK